MFYGYDLDGVRTEKTVTTHTLHTHVYQADRVVAPTCTRSGYTVLKCACGTEKRTDYVNSTGHSYLYSRTVEPTCTENGYKLYVCTVCGDTTTRDVTEPLGHDYGPKWNLKQVCQRCGKPASVVPTDPIPVDPKPTDVVADPEEESEEAVLPTESDTVVNEEQTVSSYLYASGKLLQEKVTTDGKTETHNFFYDNSGTPYAMQVDGTTYYYITNLQGDVMELVDASGNTVASYTYSPYGKVLTSEGTLADKNPLRYRGYYYDAESGLYYLQSRYYDPNIGRFINADDYVGTGQGVLGYNMFAYCNSSPIQFADYTGYAYCNAMSETITCGIGGGIQFPKIGKSIGRVYDQVKRGLTCGLIMGIQLGISALLLCDDYRPLTIVKNMIDCGLFGDMYYGESQYLMDFEQRPGFPESVQPWRKKAYFGRRGHPYITHTLGPVCYALGSDIKSVSCMAAGKREDVVADKTCALMLQTQNGSMIRLRNSFMCARPDLYTYYSVQGTKGCYQGTIGSMDYHKVHIRGLCGSNEWRNLYDFKGFLPKEWQIFPDGYFNDASDDGCTLYDSGTPLLLESFAKAILEDTEPLVSAKRSLNWTAAGILSEESVNNGGVPVEIPDFGL